MGQSSFKVQIRPGIFQDVHFDQIKQSELDEAVGIGPPITYRRDELDQQSQGKVQKIKGRRFNDRGEPEFLTHWEGTPASEDTWEPAFTFLTNCSPEWLEYCWSHNIGIDVLKAMTAEREMELEGVNDQLWGG